MISLVAICQKSFDGTTVATKSGKNSVKIELKPLLRQKNELR